MAPSDPIFWLADVAAPALLRSGRTATLLRLSSPPATKLVPIGQSGTLPDDYRHLRLDGTVAEVCRAMVGVYQRAGFVPPWIGYLAVAGEVAVGTCSFKSPPRGAEVEIAYFTFPHYEGRGIATMMAAALVGIASAEPGVVVTARTLPETNASSRLLDRLQFRKRGTVIDPEDGPVWEWAYAAPSAD